MLNYKYAPEILFIVFLAAYCFFGCFLNGFFNPAYTPFNPPTLMRKCEAENRPYEFLSSVLILPPHPFI